MLSARSPFSWVRNAPQPVGGLMLLTGVTRNANLYGPIAGRVAQGTARRHPRAERRGGAGRLAAGGPGAAHRRPQVPRQVCGSVRLPWDGLVL